MSVKQFLRMMPQIDRRYLDEAYRVTADSQNSTTSKKRSGIMKKVTKIAVAAALCAAAVIGAAAVISRMKDGLDVSRNPHGSGYAGNALDTPKFRAELPAVQTTAPARIGDMSYAPISAARMQNAHLGENYSSTTRSSEMLTFSDKGCYYLGNPTAESRTMGICFADATTGESVYLCAKPECMHDGSDYCIATNKNYNIMELVWYEDMLYALAENTVSHSTVLLMINPVGTALDELAVLDDRAALFQPEMIAYRGALWVSGVLYAEISDDDIAIGTGSTRTETYHGIWHYDLMQKRLTVVTCAKGDSKWYRDQLKRLPAEEEQKALEQEHDLFNLQADGDYAYFCKMKDYNDGMEPGIYRISAENGIVERIADAPDNGQYMAAGGKVMYITMEPGDPQQNTNDSYTMHTLENGVETAAVGVPRGWKYATDGNYLFIEVNGEILTICDMQGNRLKKEEFPAPKRENALRDSHSFAYADGVLYHMTVHENDGALRYTELTYESVSLQAYLDGTADFVQLYDIYRISEGAWEQYDKGAPLGAGG